jgi:hypothetical protein
MPKIAARRGARTTDIVAMTSAGHSYGYRATALVAHLMRDPTLRGRWSTGPTEFGCNTFEGYVNEDVTRALDQIIGERVGGTSMDDADPARARTGRRISHGGGGPLPS